MFHDLLSESGQGFGGEVAAAHLPFVVLFGQDRPDQAKDGGSVGEDAHDIGAAFDLAIQAFERIIAPELTPVLSGKGQRGSHLLLGIV